METAQEAQERRRRVCTRCHYACMVSGGKSYRYCDFYGPTGRLRPCAPEDCVRLGIFRPLGKKKPVTPFAHYREER